MNAPIRARVTTLVLLFSVCVGTRLGADEFRFQYAVGEQYRIVSHVDEDVYINGSFSHRADILNRIAVEVISVDGSTGELDATFQTSERSSGQAGVYEWAEEYNSRYFRDEYGRYEIGTEYFMPVVRNVPLFPERDVSEGETWSARGEEVHDFRANFGVPDAYRFPIDVSYTYLGKSEFEGKEYEEISIRYAVFHKADRQPGIALYPIRITGFSDQTLFFDNTVGRPHHYSEEFHFVVTLSSGDTVEYEGTAEATVVEATRMNKVDVAEEIQREIEESELADTEVRVSELGVTVSLQNIQFLPDSAVLRTSEKKKLDTIATILKRYPDRDVLIVGHTALAGTAAGRQLLSEERAASVGDYLLETGVRRADQIVTRGVGANEPIATNDTEVGRRKNRRVEITILEN